MKPKRYERHYTDTTPLKDGMSYQRAQLTGIQRNKAKLGFNCEHCGLPFEKYACWAKRTAHHYCGRACASAARVVRIPKPCVVCGTEMLLAPHNFNRVSGCSRACSRKRRTVNHTNLRSSPDYVAIVKRLKKEALCGVCGTTNGPWVARGVKTWVKDGLSYADGSNAYLVCRHCHLRGVAYLSLQSTYMSNRATYYKEKNG